MQISIKKKFDYFMFLLIGIFLITVIISFGVTHNMQQKTEELVDLTKELDFLTNLRTTLLNLSYSLNEFLKYNDEKSKANIENGIKNLHRIIASSRSLNLDSDEKKIIDYLINNIKKFDSFLNKILFSQNQADIAMANEALKVELFSKVLEQIDEHWYKDFEKIYRAQVASKRAQIFVFHFYTALLVILLLIFLIIRRTLKKGFILPIIELSRTSFKMAAGELTHRIKINSGDELEDLGKNFNLMAEALQEKIADLESYIKKEQKLIRELSILTEFIGYVVSERDMDVLFERFIERTRDLLKADNAAINLYSIGNEGAFYSTSEQIDLQVLESVLRKRGITYDDILSSQEIVNIEITNPTLQRLYNINYALFMPISSSTSLRAVITLFRKDTPFSEDDENSLFNFAFQAFQTISLQNEISKLAKTDGLTGLYNHRVFQERIKEEILRASRYKRTLFLLMADIDHFKKINDTYGHQVGDMVLKTVADIIKKNVRQLDFPARYGGEEFALILPETDCDNAYKVGERIRKAIENHEFRLEDGKTFRVTISIGIACFPIDSKDREELVKKADQALYYAKQEGRNRVCLYNSISK